MNRLHGTAWLFGNDINTDLIIPARYLNTSDSKELAAHCMEDAEFGFSAKIKPGDILVAGKNFGCGSSREHAPIAIKAAGISCVIAVSFARIFYRNAINIGLPILESPQAGLAVRNGDIVEVDLDSGEIINLSRDQVFQAALFPQFMQDLIQAGGLIEYVKSRLGR